MIISTLVVVIDISYFCLVVGFVLVSWIDLLWHVLCLPFLGRRCLFVPDTDFVFFTSCINMLVSIYKSKRNFQKFESFHFIRKINLSARSRITEASSIKKRDFLFQKSCVRELGFNVLPIRMRSVVF